MAEGTLKVRVTTSNALLPLHGVPVVISRDDGNGKRTLLAVKTTDQNGDIPPLKVETPSLSESQSSGQGELHTAYNHRGRSGLLQDRGRRRPGIPRHDIHTES